ncbi:anthrone oxygenase family protein [Anderseniella sp. Alg231-50]|uniref:anthrone oxygenase family protein n=1 Tax=Anderseniella sp. Alg231-50 TaxID=1922226 RepID=UPI00307CC4A4
MTMDFVLIACCVAVIASGLIAGVFLAFSDFLMKSLAAASPAGGIEAMQLINRKVYGSVFLFLLVAMLAVSAALAFYASMYMTGPASAWIISASVLYAVGMFIVTVVFNVPMNRRLDAMNHESTETASYWTVYASSWTLWNHVRTVASAASAACFLIGCLALGGG